MVGEVSSLEHEVGNNTMEAGPRITKSLLAFKTMIKQTR